MFDNFMPRTTRAFRIDDRALEALDRLSAKGNISANKYLENLLMSHAKQAGEIPMDAEPLGDPRGGKRVNAGRKAKERNKDVTQESSEDEGEK
jgi:hypothetical protein